MMESPAEKNKVLGDVISRYDKLLSTSKLDALGYEQKTSDLSKIKELLYKYNQQ